jgi:hypothetical protein
LNQFSGSIRRMVIQDENFKDRVIAIRNRAQTWAKPRFFVPCGDENGNSRGGVMERRNFGKTKGS